MGSRLTEGPRPSNAPHGRPDAEHAFTSEQPITGRSSDWSHARNRVGQPPQNRLLWLVVILLLAAVGWLIAKDYLFNQSGDPVGSAMLAFEKQNELVVFSSRFEVVAESEDTRGPMGIDVLTSRRATIVPASVDYRLDLAQMQRDNFAWDEAEQQMIVTLPQLRISRPNLDEANQRQFTEGLWVTRDADRELDRENSIQAERKATEFAQNPQVMGLAQEAAKQAVRQNLAVPLQVAGYDKAQVIVRFEHQKGPK